ncbi:DUF938 domain-containing protein [Candidatus Berkiella cookevillensis]|uniref:DUF938 domain-containing protein n=1 Tax=Candidatus Berkiella cookevillensis TaxID=437022 RepID=A0A0Q9Y8U9_9GAMM|nr:DUF938 domain-containing protein [Candidatus Berkiella cookevillensis]MCS5709749.1 DUF938 domain-containing protein [Candidatus Berkiella cookevillensis]
MNKQFSPACDRNKDSILEILRSLLKDKSMIFEIGTGTGQHAVFFSKNLSHLQWQTSDLIHNHANIKMWLEEAKLSNVLPPVIFDASIDKIPSHDYDAVFTANTFHIMAWPQVCCCIEKVGQCLKKKGLFIIYGPFNFNGQYTSLSNECFEQQLIDKNPNMGIRNFEDITQHCLTSQMRFIEKYPMPANNFILVFQKN